MKSMKLPQWQCHSNKPGSNYKNNKNNNTNNYYKKGYTRDSIKPLKSFMLNIENYERFQRLQGDLAIRSKSRHITKASLFEPLSKAEADANTDADAESFAQTQGEGESESESSEYLAKETLCMTLFECVCSIIFEEDFQNLHPNSNAEFSLKHKQAYAFKILEFLLKKQGKRNAKILATEQSMLYEKDITFEILQVICSYYKINIIYELDYAYYLIDEEEEETTENSCFFLIKKEKKNFKISKKKKKILEKIEKKKIFLEKKLKNIGNYKLGELTEMAQKVGIATEKQYGKRRTKAELYEEIVLKLN